jgi:hypothetical protein
MPYPSPPSFSQPPSYPPPFQPEPPTSHLALVSLNIRPSSTTFTKSPRLRQFTDRLLRDRLRHRLRRRPSYRRDVVVQFDNIPAGSYGCQLEAYFPGDTLTGTAPARSTSSRSTSTPLRRHVGYRTAATQPGRHNHVRGRPIRARQTRRQLRRLQFNPHVSFHHRQHHCGRRSVFPQAPGVNGQG